MSLHLVASVTYFIDVSFSLTFVSLTLRVCGLGHVPGALNSLHLVALATYLVP